MLIAHIDFKVAAIDHDKALSVLKSEAPVVRDLAGNLGYTYLVHPDQPGHLVLIHEWADMAAFGNYRNTPGFKAVGDLLFPMMIAKPSTRLFDASQKET